MPISKEVNSPHDDPCERTAQSGQVLRWLGPLNLIDQDATMTHVVDLLNRPREVVRMVIDKAERAST